MKQLLLVFLGGGLGSSLRYLISKYINTTLAIPYGTLFVNIVGCLIIGVILGLALKNTNISDNTVLFLATGFCGGFTTFSAFAYENQAFLKSGDFVSLVTYTIGSIVLGFLAIGIGLWLAKLI